MVVLKISLKKVTELTEKEIGIRLLRSTKMALIIQHSEKREKINAAYENLIDKKCPKTIEESLAMFDAEMNNARPLS